VTWLNNLNRMNLIEKTNVKNTSKNLIVINDFLKLFLAYLL
jgi:hypothetical protein